MKMNLIGKALLCLLCVSMYGVIYAQKTEESLELIILDSTTKEGIEHVILTIGNQHFFTNEKGKCTLSLKDRNVGMFLDIELLGYKTQQVSLNDVRKTQPFVIGLDLESQQLDELVVDARNQSSFRNSVAQEISSFDISKNVGNSMTASLEKMKGVSFIQSGATVVKPVIQGMHSNRILILNNGVRQEGQSWGDDHAPELDVNNVEYLTVIKGAESVRYGSQALGGVLKMESRALPYGRKSMKGRWSNSYGSNGKRYATTGLLDGSLPFHRNIAWRVQGTYLNGGDRSTAKYVLNNTGMREFDFSAALGYQRDHFGVDLFYSRYDSKLGVLYTSQHGDVDLFKELIQIGRPLDVSPFSRHIDYPYQQVIHQIVRLKSFYKFPNKSQLNVQYAYQTDHRDEFHMRRNNLSRVPSLSLDLSSHQFDLDWVYPYLNYFKTEIGAFFGSSNNANKPGTGVVPIIPNYTQQRFGLFALQRLTKERWGIEAGVRMDREVNRADGFDSYGERYGGLRQFGNLTYNVGGNYQISSNWSVVSNVGLAWRAPHVYELYSNGLDHASGIYVIGDANLKSEKSTKWITSLNYDARMFSFSVDGYLQWVRNFIYDEPSQNYITVVSGTYPVFEFKQVNAYFRGVDAELSIKPLDHFQYDLKGSLIWANEQHTGRYLPYIPSFHLMQSIGYTLPKWRRLEEVGVRLNHKYVAKQNRFDAETDLVSFTPSAYHLFGLEMGITLPINQTHRLTFLVESSNIFNKQYKEYTNRFRYYAHDAGRDIRIVALWNF